MRFKRADELKAGDVLVGFPVGPMTVRLVTPSRRAGEPAGVRIAFERHAPITGTPADKPYAVEDQ